MWGVVELLVLFEHISQYVTTYWEMAKETARQYLGPSPHTKYLIFDNDEVIPEGREHCKYAHVAHYIPHEHRIVALDSSAPNKRLPWISIQHCIGDHVVDLTDWMADIRANTPISLLAFVRVAAQAQNQHLPETASAKVVVITREGEEEEYRFSCKTKLLRRIEPTPVRIEEAEIHRRITCPFDMEGGLFF